MAKKKDLAQKKELERKRYKVLKTVVAVVLVLAIALMGTYAWQSFSQELGNKVSLDVNPGGRLHDDFNGENKDVYVENFGDIPIVVRIRLDEYMEVGPDAGKNLDDENRDATPVLEGTNIHDKSTWVTYQHEDYQQNQLHVYYWNWKMGGSTVYMPTFNKDNTSLKADINGTYEGPDGDPNTSSDCYADYQKYKIGDKKTAEAVYAGKRIEEEHEAKQTQEATVISMKKWIEGGCNPGKYWIYDSDGWAYWGEELQPEEATGLLLDQVKLKGVISGPTFYKINVIAQCATIDDLGDETKKTGFYEDGMTDDASYLLKLFSGVVDEITIDGIPFYVLAEDKANNKMLIWSKEMLPKAMYFSNSGTKWQDSLIRTYLNGEWLDDHPTLKARVIQTDITTRSTYDSSTFLTTQDKVFELSEADLYGTYKSGTATGNANDYTYKGRRLPITVDMIKCAPCTDPNAYVNAVGKGVCYWLRSPSTSGCVEVAEGPTAKHGIASCNVAFGLRPALWITINN